MISKATLHKATVLMNRRMNTERRVTTFGPVCSSVAGMALHHLEGRRDVQERTTHNHQPFISAHQPHGVTCPTCTTLPRIVPAFAPDREERVRRSEHRCPHIAARGRDRLDESPRSKRFRLREFESESAFAMS